MLALTRSGTWIVNYGSLICVTGILCVVTKLAETIQKFPIVTGICDPCSVFEMSLQVYLGRSFEGQFSRNKYFFMGQFLKNMIVSILNCLTFML